MDNNYSVKEKDQNEFEVEINGEVVKMNFFDHNVREDLENMGLIEKDNNESFYGYLIKTAKTWIEKRHMMNQKSQNEI